MIEMTPMSPIVLRTSVVDAADPPCGEGMMNSNALRPALDERDQAITASFERPLDEASRRTWEAPPEHDWVRFRVRFTAVDDVEVRGWSHQLPTRVEQAPVGERVSVMVTGEGADVRFTSAHAVRVGSRTSKVCRDRGSRIESVTHRVATAQGNGARRCGVFDDVVSCRPGSGFDALPEAAEVQAPRLGAGGVFRAAVVVVGVPVVLDRCQDQVLVVPVVAGGASGAPHQSCGARGGGGAGSCRRASPRSAEGLERVRPGRPRWGGREA
ncbi:hypothetical protein C8E97_1344 [Saccharothrix australiensis]|uniref:Uncharacterized protein n=1 Tax=Saccharothrix australiensis TaxID=2072 RepID=A0A495VTW1_9PSEU|nr:hypothetical protein C8E97_1344 [Saccharothrix australiensis]